MFDGRLSVVVLRLIEVQIYPIDVVKTQFQKRQLETGRAQVSRPDIKFFQPGSYRGKSFEDTYQEHQLINIQALESASDALR